MSENLCDNIAKQLAIDAIFVAEKEIHDEDKNFRAAIQEKGRLLADSAIREAVFELEDERSAALKYLESQIAKETAVSPVSDKAMKIAYDRMANRLAIDAINEANDELHQEFSKRMEDIAAFDWASVDKHIQETLDARKAGLREVGRKQGERRGTPLLGERGCSTPLVEQGCLPNSISDSVMDTRPWRRYVTIDMGDVVVRAHSDVVNFFISPRDTPTPTELSLESPTRYDVITLTSQTAFNGNIVTNTDLGISDDTATSSVRTNQEKNVLSKKPKKKNGFISRCRKVFRSLFSCHKAQTVD